MDILKDNERGLNVARRLADWYVKDQTKVTDTDPCAGTFHFQIFPESRNCPPVRSSQWELSFPIMGLLSAAEVFKNEVYLDTAKGMMGYLKTLQVLDPFHKKHFGAFRENTPQTPWCYTRDALSAAWCCLEYYKIFHEEEYLERACLWANWFLKHGMDETGWPLWGVILDPPLIGTKLEPMRLDIHGSFQCGSLNFFYALANTTGDKSWTGPFFEHIADYFCTYIQQPDGMYRSIDKTTRTVPEDPQDGLHRSNDDLGSLGLLCAYRVYGKKVYLQTIERFLKRVFELQCDDGNLEHSCAGIPVILNTIKEAHGLMDLSYYDDACGRALQALYNRQFPEGTGSFAGALNEQDGVLCSRSMAYTLIYLLKNFGGDKRFLSAAE